MFINVIRVSIISLFMRGRITLIVITTECAHHVAPFFTNACVKALTATWYAHITHFYSFALNKNAASSTQTKQHRKG